MPAATESRPSLRYFDILKSVIRLLATDLDGTFWGPDFVAPPEHVAAVDEDRRQHQPMLGKAQFCQSRAPGRCGQNGYTLACQLIDSS